MTSLRRLIEFNPAVPEFAALPDDAVVTFVPLDAVWTGRRADFSRRIAKGEVAVGYSRFLDGDILLPKVSPTFEAGRVAIAQAASGIGAATTEVHVLRARPGIDPRFVAYVCQSARFLAEGAASQQGVGNLRRVSSDFVLNFPVSRASRDEQRAVADYLDGQTSRIDALIARQLELIRLLGERREALLFAIVAASASTASGEGAGATLAWPALARSAQQPLRRVIKPINRPVPEGAEIVTAYTDGQVTRRSNRAKRGYHEAADLSGFQGVDEGDFVVHGLDILRGSVGIADSSGAISSVCTVAKVSDQVDDRYLAMAVRLQARSGYTRALARGIRSGGADFRRWDTLAELPVPVPPLIEQRMAAERFEAESANMDALLVKVRDHIALAKERRSALITAAVTGQIDVRTASRRVA